MVCFNTPGAAHKYYKKRITTEQFCYILNYKQIKIDNLNGLQFMQRQAESTQSMRKIKMEKAKKKQKQKVIFIKLITLGTSETCKYFIIIFRSFKMLLRKKKLRSNQRKVNNLDFMRSRTKREGEFLSKLNPSRLPRHW